MEATGTNSEFLQLLLTEVAFTASRSSGPGGQHVNKVNTRVELKFNLTESKFLTPEQKERLQLKLANRISKKGILSVSSQEKRSQVLNKEICIEKFISLIETALTPEKERKSTKPSKATKLKRLEEKKKTAQKKEQRKPPEVE